MTSEWRVTFKPSGEVKVLDISEMLKLNQESFDDAGGRQGAMQIIMAATGRLETEKYDAINW